MILTILLIIIIGYVGGVSIDRLSRASASLGLFLIAGGHFLLVGRLIGPSGLRLRGDLTLIEPEVLVALWPLVQVGLAWIGLILGLQLDLRQLSRFPARYWWSGAAQFGVTALVAYLGTWLTLWATLPRHLIDGEWRLAHYSFTVLAFLTSPLPLAYIMKRMKLARTRFEYLRFLVNINGIIGITLFQLVLLSFEVGGRQGVGEGLGQWLTGFALAVGGSVAMGIGMGVLAHLFLLYSYSRNDQLAITIGLLCLTSGMSTLLGLDGLFVSLIMGVVLVHFSPRSELLFRVLIQSERPVFALLMLLAGAYWRNPLPSQLLVIAMCMVVYVAAKWVGGFVGAWTAPMAIRYPEAHGFLFLPQGSLALALALGLSDGQALSSEVLGFFQTLVIMICLLSTLSADRVYRYYLRESGMLLTGRHALHEEAA